MSEFEYLNWKNNTFYSHIYHQYMNLKNLNLKTLTLTAWLIASLHGTNAISTKTKQEISNVYAQENEEEDSEL